jgi:hypothetical protein
MPEYLPDKLCVCGCTADEHHQVWYVGGGHTYDECEKYGSDGMMQVHLDGSGPCTPDQYKKIDGHFQRIVLCDRKHQWVDHCQRFTPVAIPIGLKAGL